MLTATLPDLICSEVCLFVVSRVTERFNACNLVLDGLI